MCPPREHSTHSDSLPHHIRGSLSTSRLFVSEADETLQYMTGYFLLTHCWPWGVWIRQCVIPHTDSHSWAQANSNLPQRADTNHSQMNTNAWKYRHNFKVIPNCQQRHSILCVHCILPSWLLSLTSLLSSSLLLCWLTSSSTELSLMSPSLPAPTLYCYQQLLIRVMEIQEVSSGVPAWKWKCPPLPVTRSHVFHEKHWCTTHVTCGGDKLRGRSPSRVIIPTKSGNSPLKCSHLCI